MSTFPQHFSNTLSLTLWRMSQSRERAAPILPTFGLLGLWWPRREAFTPHLLHSGWLPHGSCPPSTGPMINHWVKSPLGRPENAPLLSAPWRPEVCYSVFWENSFVAHTVGSPRTRSASSHSHIPRPHQTNAHSEHWDVIRGQNPTTFTFTSNYLQSVTWILD